MNCVHLLLLSMNSMVIIKCANRRIEAIMAACALSIHDVF